MSVEWITSILEVAAVDPPDADSFFECCFCGAVYEEWPDSCHRCDQLVVRIVERRAATARR